MTARSEYNKDIAIQKGFDNYLRKPFSIKDLASIFNSETYIEEENKQSKFSKDFPELSSMFDYDEDSIRNILKIFVSISNIPFARRFEIVFT